MENHNGYDTTNHFIKGRKVCSAIIQLKANTINAHAAFVASSPRFIPYISKSCNEIKGKRSLQSMVAVMFSQRYEELKAMECPKRRGSSDDAPMRWLPSETTNQLVRN